METLAIDELKLHALKEYFDKRSDIVFAFLFGSAVRGKIRREGDIDIAVYFWPEKDIEWEDFNKTYKGENKIGVDLERLLKKEVDLIVLNRARAILADEIIRKGKPILIKDRGIFMNFLCIISDEAEYVRDWLEASYKERRFESIGI
jgi:predicted nucleotidyltransferase